MLEARCDDALTRARRLVALDPAAPDAREMLAAELYATGAPIAEVRAAAAEAIARSAPEARVAEGHRLAAIVATLEGRFDEARREAEALGDARLRIALAVEIGDRAGATRLAHDSSSERTRAAWERDPDVDDVEGSALLAAHRIVDALPLLEHGARSCAAWLAPIGHMRSRLHLGEALEADGRRREACAAYAFVSEKWLDPRSVTATAARARMHALACITP
jgi:hypothetical protein